MHHVLVVEDSASTRARVRATLESGARAEHAEEIRVTEATSGIDAMRLLPRQEYSLVITDINMPGINGLELIHFIRQTPHLKGLRILVISTQSSERDVQRSLKLGADAFLAKPFSDADLWSACRAYLKRRADRE
jgi:two-component system chemotaxis response regulator CheY